MSEDAEFRPFVTFPDGSPSFVNGFEAGMIWQMMQDGVEEIAPQTPTHWENLPLFIEMAKAANYEIVECEQLDQAEWGNVTFRKSKPKSHLTVIK